MVFMWMCKVVCVCECVYVVESLRLSSAYLVSCTIAACV